MGAPLEERFGPHCCRHWFTTHLHRAGMPREFIQELRGDVRREAIDIYDHIGREELKKTIWRIHRRWLLEPIQGLPSRARWMALREGCEGSDGRTLFLYCCILR